MPGAMAEGLDDGCVGDEATLHVCATTGHFTSASAHHSSGAALVAVDFYTVPGFAGQITSLEAQAGTGSAVDPPAGVQARAFCNDMASTPQPCDQSELFAGPR